MESLDTSDTHLKALMLLQLQAYRANNQVQLGLHNDAISEVILIRNMLEATQPVPLEEPPVETDLHSQLQQAYNSGDVQAMQDILRQMHPEPSEE